MVVWHPAPQHDNLPSTQQPLPAAKAPGSKEVDAAMSTMCPVTTRSQASSETLGHLEVAPDTSSWPTQCAPRELIHHTRRPPCMKEAASPPASSRTTWPGEGA
jgi:hypothetical protein